MLRLVTLLLIFLVASGHCEAQTAESLIRTSVAYLGSHSDAIFDRAVIDWAKLEGREQVARLQAMGPTAKVTNMDGTVSEGVWVVVGRVTHTKGVSDWTVIYSRSTARISRIRLKTYFDGDPIPPAPELRVTRGAGTSASLDPCTAVPEICNRQRDGVDDLRSVEFLFATTRAPATGAARITFTGERGASLTRGSARVHVPLDHRLGRIELPASVGFLGITLYEEQTDPDRHFLIKEVRTLTQNDWDRVIREKGSKEALVFVHGFNNSFDDSVYRFAQIVWDLQYGGLPVLFSWASRGSTINYAYDRESALLGRHAFLDLLRELRDKHKVTTINILAHSMGNFLVLDALSMSSQSAAPVSVGELMMAAPDVDRDQFKSALATAAPLLRGMTLYASSADKALALSKHVAGNIHRAGDVPEDGPILVSGLHSIDATAIGEDLFGLNHNTFSSSRSLINDIGLLLSTVPKRAPHLRLREIRPVPDPIEPRYWRFAN